MNENFFEPLSAAMEVLGDTMYIGPFRNAIHVGANENYFDIQTGDAFVNVFSHHKSGSNPSANEAMFEMLQEIRRIFGFQNLDINPSGQTLQLTIDGRSYRLSEQGAGFAHFVVVMVNVLVRRPKLLLIDEPELNLHASLQLDFLQTLAKYTEFGVIFATHSLGLARTAGDQIYTLTKPSGGTSVLRSYEDNQDLVTLLGQLSFDNRPEMGFSKVLLVEGKTELRALMQFLRLYGKEHEVLMLPLHGGDLIRPDSEPELTDLLRIGGSMHYIIDSEREVAGAALESSRQGFVDLCERLGVPGLVLERRALENYFTDDAVKRAMGSAAQGLGPYDKLARTPGASWRKTDNWRVASEMRKEDLEDTDLGIFLRSL
ncbi:MULTISPECIES: AAA family ATPase [unclassified Streptomyces]|uniref:ATP-dependent nuclease n=1 Tax=unclassified Streptomyces TaxID=2593676 RepID=UPI001F0876BB|nr:MULTISPECIES: AAA family ATPase [unclassified Streptomyces]